MLPTKNMLVIFVSITGVGYYTMSAGKQLPKSLTHIFRVCQPEKSRHAIIILWVYFVGT